MASKYFLILSLICTGLLFYNALTFNHQYQEWIKKPTVPLHSLVDKFTGLTEVFKDVPYAGYYTDKDITAPLTIAQFEQAQYALAPTVLVLNHTNYRLVLFDCTSPAVAMAKIKELGMQAIKTNAEIILALRAGNEINVNPAQH